MKVTIDRFEGGFAIVELPNRQFVNLPVEVVPQAKEGDIVEIQILPQETQQRKAKIDQLAKKLWADD